MTVALKHYMLAALIALSAPAYIFGSTRSGADALLAGFHNPPRQARLHCYWWWLNGNTTQATITRDLEQMKAKGYGGVILIDANGSNQGGNKGVPPGPLFGSPEWRILYRHALQEAARLGLEISLTIQSGWNLGGPGVKPEDASKILTFSREIVQGPTDLRKKLVQPPSKNEFYRDIAVLVYPLLEGKQLPGIGGDARHPIRLLSEKAAFKEVGPFSMPQTKQLLEDYAPQPNEEDTRAKAVRDITSQFSNGELKWHAPAGTWEILRVGYTDSGAKVSTSSGNWQGLAIDYMDRSAFENYWRQNVIPLLSDARRYIGQSLRYLVTDSWELGGTNWTTRFRTEFIRRRGYDALPYLPVVSGRIVDSRDVSNRFLNDFRKTISELIAENNYGTFAQLAKQNGLGIHPESGGPHGAPIDALLTLGMSTFPQTEFWAKSPIHRSRDEDRFFVKEASSAAHIYGKQLVAAEGMTSIGPQWEEEIWNDLKPTFDQAVCAGLNLLFWHTFTSSPAKFGLPGEEYFAGTHLNPNVTWWKFAGPFIRYINRTQFLMQQGVPVADVLYYYGDRVPNFVRLKRSDPANALPGYDYDVINEDVLVHRPKVENGRILLPGGASYKLLAIGDRPNISLAALRKIRQLVSEGATVVGRKPERTTGMDVGRNEDTEVRALANEVWGNCSGNQEEHVFGKGRVFCSAPARDILPKLRVPPDFQSRTAEGSDQSGFDYVHRRSGNTDIYFIRNTKAAPVYAGVTLRVSGKAPELWHADTGVIEDQPIYRETRDGRTTIPLWLEPYGSICVVFRSKAGDHFTSLIKDGKMIFPITQPGIMPQVELKRDHDRWTLESTVPGHYSISKRDGSTFRANLATSSPESSLKLRGAWNVRFPPRWGAPPSIKFDALKSWALDANPGIRYFSGTAIYSKEIDIPSDLAKAGQSLSLNLGDVREIAQVNINGKNAGIVWKKPFIIPLNGMVKPGHNKLEIAVANLWPNRLIGDQQLPPGKRFTRTNIRKFTANSPLLPSGLLGPVKLVPVLSGVLTPAR